MSLSLWTPTSNPSTLNYHHHTHTHSGLPPKWCGHVRVCFGYHMTNRILKFPLTYRRGTMCISKATAQSLWHEDEYIRIATLTTEPISIRSRYTQARSTWTNNMLDRSIGIQFITRQTTHDPCSTILLEMPIGPLLVYKFPKLYGTWRLITVFTRTHHLSLRWARWI